MSSAAAPPAEIHTSGSDTTITDDNICQTVVLYETHCHGGNTTGESESSSSRKTPEGASDPYNGVDIVLKNVT